MLDCHIKNAWAKKYILIHLVGRRQNQVHITAQKSKWCKSSLNWMKLCTIMMWEIFILESYSMSISYFTFKRIFSTKIQIVISKRVQRLHFWKCFSWKERAGPKVNKSYYIMITIMRFGAAFFTFSAHCEMCWCLSPSHPITFFSLSLFLASLSPLKDLCGII